MSKPTHTVSVAIETGNPEAGESNTFWHDIGSAWMNEKGQISVQLKSNPLDGRFMLFPVQDKD